MRAPSQRMRDCGNGPDTITVWTAGIDNVADADEEGNWIKRPVTPRDFDAIVDSTVASGTDQNGTDLSVTVVRILIYTDTDPQIKNEDTIGHRGRIMVAQGVATPAAGGAWEVTAIEDGPNPSTTGLPEGVE